jgi:hypothetical protein
MYSKLISTLWLRDTGGIDDAGGDPSVVDVAVESDAGDDTDSGAAGSDDEGVAVGNESIGGGGDAAAAACAVLVTALWLRDTDVSAGDVQHLSFPSHVLFT